MYGSTKDQTISDASNPICLNFWVYTETVKHTSAEIFAFAESSKVFKRLWYVLAQANSAWSIDIVVCVKVATFSPVFQQFAIFLGECRFRSNTTCIHPSKWKHVCTRNTQNRQKKLFHTTHIIGWKKLIINAFCSKQKIYVQ